MCVRVYLLVERYIGTFYIFPFCFTILFLSTSRVWCRSFRRSRVESAAQHRVYRENIFCVNLSVLCTENIYKSVYWNSTNETNSDETSTRLLHSSHRFFSLMVNSSFFQPNDQRKHGEVKLFFLHYGCFFPLLRTKHIKITSSIDSIQSQTVTVEFKKYWSQNDENCVLCSISIPVLVLNSVFSNILSTTPRHNHFIKDSH